MIYAPTYWALSEIQLFINSLQKQSPYWILNHSVWLVDIQPSSGKPSAVLCLKLLLFFKLTKENDLTDQEFFLLLWCIQFIFGYHCWQISYPLWGFHSFTNFYIVYKGSLGCLESDHQVFYCCMFSHIFSFSLLYFSFILLFYWNSSVASW